MAAATSDSETELASGIGPETADSKDVPEDGVVDAAAALLERLQQGVLPEPPATTVPVIVEACRAEYGDGAVVITSASATVGIDGSDAGGRAGKLLRWLLTHEVAAESYREFTRRKRGSCGSGAKHLWWVLSSQSRAELTRAARSASMAQFNQWLRDDERAASATAAQKRLRDRGFDECPVCRTNLDVRSGAEGDHERPTCERCTG